MDELRSLLAEITVQDICLHANLLEDLRLRLQHTIVPLAIDPEIACASEDFMCFEYALGLIFSKEYLGIRKHEQETRMIRPLGADDEFVAFLIEKQYLTEIQGKHAEDGDLIMYFYQGKPTHAGVLVGSKRVISKWGKGLLLEHATFEVPTIYGNECRYYKSPDVGLCEDSFIEYAESMGREFVVEEDR